MPGTTAVDGRPIATDAEFRRAISAMAAAAATQSSGEADATPQCTPESVFERLSFDFPLVTPAELDILSRHLSAEALFPAGKAPSRRFVETVCDGARRAAMGNSAESSALSAAYARLAFFALVPTLYRALTIGDGGDASVQALLRNYHAAASEDATSTSLVPALGPTPEQRDGADTVEEERYGAEDDDDFVYEAMDAEDAHTAGVALGHRDHFGHTDASDEDKIADWCGHVQWAVLGEMPEADWAEDSQAAGAKTELLTRLALALREKGNAKLAAASEHLLDIVGSRLQCAPGSVEDTLPVVADLLNTDASSYRALLSILARIPLEGVSLAGWAAYNKAVREILPSLASCTSAALAACNPNKKTRVCAHEEEEAAGNVARAMHITVRYLRHGAGDAVADDLLRTGVWRDLTQLAVRAPCEESGEPLHDAIVYGSAKFPQLAAYALRVPALVTMVTMAADDGVRSYASTFPQLAAIWALLQGQGDKAVSIVDGLLNRLARPEPALSSSAASLSLFISTTNENLRVLRQLHTFADRAALLPATTRAPVRDVVSRAHAQHIVPLLSAYTQLSLPEPVAPATGDGMAVADAAGADAETEAEQELVGKARALYGECQASLRALHISLKELGAADRGTRKRD